jgi:hypothetical protein
MLNAVTWAYATLCWTYHVNHASNSGIPHRTLLQALMSFDLFACYLNRFKMQSECQDTIKRVAFPPRPATVIFKIAENL